MPTWPTWEESRRRREQAIELRRQGLSYKEIRAQVGGSSSSMSLWLRDVPVPPERQARLRRRRRDAVIRTSLALRQKRLDRQDQIKREAIGEFGELTERELFVAGIVLYAAEGAKQKPWQTAVSTQLINSDPRVIRLFLRWLDLLDIGRSELIFRVAIHESADVGTAVRFWADLVGAPPESFRPTTLKRGDRATNRRNVGSGYRGCLVVTVRRSTDLTRRIDA